MSQRYRELVRLELLQLMRNRTHMGLIGILLLLMTAATWNTSRYLDSKKAEVERQTTIVESNDQQLVAQIDSLNQGLATYETSYTLPTNGVRLTYNNHRVTTLPFSPLSVIAMGQGDLQSNYKKIVLYFDTSYEMSSEELVSPLEQLFGQLDLAFIWTYLLPLIILLVSFNLLSLERETGRLRLIASQPTSIGYWLLIRMGLRFLVIFVCISIGTLLLLGFFGTEAFASIAAIGQLLAILFCYCAFWFTLSFLINLAGYSSGNSLIILTSTWVFLVFLLPSIVNQAGNELHPIPSRLEVVNNHQAKYNEMEGNLDTELLGLFESHPDWQSDDPVTKDMTNSTGWNINYLAKQYIAQIKHQPFAEKYEAQVDARNAWMQQLRFLSPALVLKNSLTHLAGTSGMHYRSFLRQSVEYAQGYRAFVFGGLFNNHAFTSHEIKNLPRFTYDRDRVPRSYSKDFVVLMMYLMVVLTGCWIILKIKT